MARPTRDVPWLDTRDGVYTVNWYEAPTTPAQKGRTKRLSLRTTDADVAKDRFAAFLVKGIDVVTGSARTAGLTVSDMLDQYWIEHVHKRVVDKGRQELAIRHLKLWFGDTQASAIDIAECEAYASARRRGISSAMKRTGDTRVSDSTIRRELNVLQAASKHALKRKRITGELPTFELPPEDPTRSGEAAFYTKDELNLLIKSATGDLRDFITLAYYTAGRAKSIERLEARQINFGAGTIALAKPGEVRTKKRRPTLPIFPEIREVLDRRIKASKDGFLFGPRFSVYMKFRTLCETIGLDDKRNPHLLRHSRASHLLMAGESIYKVAKLLGDTVATVETKYGHCSAEFLLERRD